MPKQVEPLSVLKPSVEITTSARVKLMRARKHVKKLNNVIADAMVESALERVLSLESYLKKQLVAEKRLSDEQKHKAKTNCQVRNARSENCW